MGTVSLSSPEYQAALRRLAIELDAAGHGRKAKIAARFADSQGLSVQTVYRHLKSTGLHESGRKRRRDAGSTGQDEAAVKAVAAMLNMGVRANGKRTMAATTAVGIAVANGLQVDVSPSRMRSLIRQQFPGVREQASPHGSLKSLHPNHVHLVDPSLCLIYYTPQGEQRVVREDEFYKNKPGNIVSINERRVWRYVLVDHYSSTIIVRYYQAAGESAENLYDFLLWCWEKREGDVFHGVPRILYTDKGSANKASAICNAMRSLDVTVITHEKGNPRAKGAVEAANNLVECDFESRFRVEPVQSVEQMNAHADAWCAAYNSNALPGQDTRIDRPGMDEPKVRYGLWQVIRREHLRILPPVELCRPLLRAAPQSRQVRADMTITFAHPAAKRACTYDLRQVQGVFPRCKVEVSPLLTGGADVIVAFEDHEGELRELVVEPVRFDAFTGFREDAAVIGEEHKRLPDTVADTSAKDADRIAYPGLSDDEIAKAKDKHQVPFDGALKAHSYLPGLEAPAYMTRPGQQLTVPGPGHYETPPLTHTRACLLLRARVGRDLTREENQLVRDRYPDGVPEDAISALVERITGRQGDAIDRTA